MERSICREQVGKKIPAHPRDITVPPQGTVRTEGEHVMEKSPVGADCAVKLNVAEYDPGPQELTARVRQK